MQPPGDLLRCEALSRGPGCVLHRPRHPSTLLAEFVPWLVSHPASPRTRSVPYSSRLDAGSEFPIREGRQHDQAEYARSRITEDRRKTEMRVSFLYPRLPPSANLSATRPRRPQELAWTPPGIPPSPHAVADLIHGASGPRLTRWSAPPIRSRPMSPDTMP